MRACTLEWKVYGHDHPPELPERLAEAGFKAADRESVLVLPLPTASLIPSQSPEIRRYVDDRGLSDHESIARALERPNATQERDRLAAEMKEHPGEMCIHVAYVAGLPVACGRLYLRAGGRVAELAGGRTHPEYRQRGLFTALVASRVAEAGEDGRELVLVDAMTTSEPILVKLGFLPAHLDKAVCIRTVTQGPETCKYRHQCCAADSLTREEGRRRQLPARRA
jgi:N-acetylglutamate synthase-like GNAT family acetyltransferase